ncbi:radical SAM protein [Mangrovibacterium diazotrophicum]|uniref:Radical SAM protein with 4Fe4S-binding SPASM domain n=1 Tax=Mangrovibacterium diazotrophicum TaxID=1261403 RepID=A0A419W931_9BACT|nr:radical SAM protein [Mangrovibacterium diazotrophicum]RKD91987.1 radical SAM protein with 4Fe4S-binding SPASM domain [Mangrovibacterium diazotrophicum]
MNQNIPMPTDVSIITTYRCQMRCKMCDIWRYPTDVKQEITAKELEMLPDFKFVNLTGGEPFQREDLEDIVEVMFRKAPRIVISTSGWHHDRILKLAEKYPNIGLRVSIEGLERTNDSLRGRIGGFERGYGLLKELSQMGIKDIGFGMTVSNLNHGDLIPLYELSRELKLEFATAAFHNSYYFHKEDNLISNKEAVNADFEKLINALLKENSPKSWFRAFFNMGLINYINGGRRMLPCEAGLVNFFIEPYGEVYPCNGLEDGIWKQSMGNIREAKNFEEIWYGEKARQVRERVANCPKNCWMVGTAAPVMKKYIKHPATWVAKNKLKSLMGQHICADQIPWFNVGQDPKQGDLNFHRLQPYNDGTGVKPDRKLPLVEE